MSKEKKPLPFRIIRFFVNFNWYASLVLFGLISILSIVMLFGFEPDALHIHIPVKIEYAADENWQQYADTQRPMILDVKGTANVLVESENIPFLGFRILFIFLAFALYIFGSYHLRQFIKLIDLKLPFAPEVPKRLRVLGITIASWGPFYGIGGYIHGKLTINSIKNIPYQLAVEKDIHLEFVFMGLLLLVIAEIMKVGVNLQKEQSLTV